MYKYRYLERLSASVFPQTQLLLLDPVGIHPTCVIKYAELIFHSFLPFYFFQFSRIFVIIFIILPI